MTATDPTPNARVHTIPVVTPEGGAVRFARYSRVSTEHQELEGQERELDEYARARGWARVATYRERVSATGRVERTEYEKLLKDSADPDRAWNHLLVWSLDRFSREERFTKAVDAIFDLERRGVSFHSLREPYLDSPPAGERNLGRELLLGILPTIATFESMRRAERTRVAMLEIRSGRRATRSGKPPGRPWRVTASKADEIVRMRAQRPPAPFKLIVQHVGLPIGTVRRVASQLRRGVSPFTTRAAHKGPQEGEGRVEAPNRPLGSDGP